MVTHIVRAAALAAVVGAAAAASCADVRRREGPHLDEAALVMSA